MRRASLLFVGLLPALLMGFLLRFPLANLLQRWGQEERTAWRLQQACGWMELALRLREQTNRRLQLAQCYQERGLFLRSQTTLEPLNASSLPPKQKVRLLNLIGVNHFNGGQASQARSAHEEALDISRTLSQPRLIAASLIELARVIYHAEQRPKQALPLLQESLALARQMGDDSLEAYALRNLGVVHWWFLEEKRSALEEYYRPALALYRELGDRRAEATMLSNIAKIYQDPIRRLEEEGRSLELREQIGDLAGRVDSLVDLAWIHIGLSQSWRARELVVEATDLANQIGYGLRADDLRRTMVWTHRTSWDESPRIVDRLLEELGPNDLNAMVIRAESLSATNLEGAIELQSKAVAGLDAAGSGQTPAMVTYLHILSRLQSLKGDSVKAHQTLAQAEEIRHRNGLSDRSHWIGWRIRLSWSQQDLPAVKRGLEELYHYWTQVQFPGESRAISEMRRLLDMLLSDGTADSQLAVLCFRLMQVLHQTRIARRLSTWSRESGSSPSRLFHSRLSGPVDQARKPAPQHALRRETPPSFKGLDLPRVRAPKDGEAQIHYYSGDENVFAFFRSPTISRCVRLPIDRATLRRQVALFRSLLQERSGSRWMKLALSLHSQLIGPFEREGLLTGVRTIALQPSGFLRDLPFAALARQVEGEARFLVEDFQLFVRLGGRDRAETPSDSNRGETLLSMGVNDPSPGEVPPLVHAEEEARQAATRFGQEAFVAEAATEETFVELAERSQSIHLAAHGVIDQRNPLLSHFRLRSSPSEDGRLSLAEILGRSLQADLVVLSACGSGRSHELLQQGPNEFFRIGFAEAFLEAGAKAVLAGLFAIDDESSLHFMRHFYSRLDRSEPTRALAETQRAFLEGMDTLPAESRERWRHPFYWSAFYLAANSVH